MLQLRDYALVNLEGTHTDAFAHYPIDQPTKHLITLLTPRRNSDQAAKNNAQLPEWPSSFIQWNDFQMLQA